MGAAALSCKQYEALIKLQSLHEVNEIPEVTRLNEERINNWEPSRQLAPLDTAQITDIQTKPFTIGIEAETASVVETAPTTDMEITVLAKKIEDACGAADWKRAKLALDGNATPMLGGFCKPLALAVKARDLELSRMLAERVADLNATDQDGNTVLMIAVKNESFDIASMLVKCGADKSSLDQKLADCCAQGDLTQAAHLLSCGAGTKRALARMVTQSKHSAIAFLIKHGAKLTSQQKESLGRQLQESCRKGDKKHIKELLNADANMEIRDHAGRTPLIIACSTSVDRPEIIKLLMEKCADIEACSPDRKDALEMCFESGHSKTAQLLLDAGAGKGMLDRAAKCLRSDDATARTKACVQLGSVLSTRASQHVSAMAKLAVEDANRMVRSAAQDGVVAIRAVMGSLPPEVLKQTKESLLALNVAHALNAYKFLNALGESDHHKSDGIQRSREALKHPDRMVREDACNVMGALGPCMGPCMPSLFECAIHEDAPEVRRAACSALVALRAGGLTLPEQEVRRHLTNASVRTAMLANFVLSELGEEEIYSADLARRFAAGLSDTERETRKAACIALGHLYDAAMNHTAALAERAAKDEWDVQVAALDSLGSIGQGWGNRPSPPYVKVLVDRANNDPNRVVRNMAVESLGKLYRDGVELNKAALQTLKTYQLALESCGSASMPRARKT